MDFKLEADDLQEVVVLCDQDGILLSWNRAGEEITGFSREDAKAALRGAMRVHALSRRGRWD